MKVAIVQEFLAAIQTSFEKHTLVKITLSKSSPKTAELTHIYIRVVEIKGASKLSFTYRYQTKDVVKNYVIEEAIEILSEQLGQHFLNATLLTTEFDWLLQYNKKRKPRVQKRKPSTTVVQSTNHNKQKQYLIAEESPFLEKIGVAVNGKVTKKQQDKYRQINKYIEVMDVLLQQATLPQKVQIVDMGCGKGYLTFALRQYLDQQQLDANLVGIELRPHLVTFCQEQAAALEWDNLQFEAKDILQYDNSQIDVLIALHACDIATDIAIAKGIEANAPLIVTAPCCHKQIRRQLDVQNSLAAILKNGILEERQAEIITDGIRALILEAYGYHTKVFEFISSEHTAKNLLITAVKKTTATAPNVEILEQVAAIKKDFGIKEHYLEKLLQLGR